MRENDGKIVYLRDGKAAVAGQKQNVLFDSGELLVQIQFASTVVNKLAETGLERQTRSLRFALEIASMIVKANSSCQIEMLAKMSDLLAALNEDTMRRVGETSNSK